MLALIRWLSRLSASATYVLGGWLGWVAWLVSPTLRRLLAHNAGLAGIPTEHRRASIAQAGRMVLELPRLWLRPAGQPIADPVRWEGAQLIEDSLGRPGGLLVLTPHMGSFEMAAQAFAERFGPAAPLTVLYRPARQAWLRELQETSRARPGIATAPASLAGVRQMMRALRRGETVGLLPDQVPPQGQGVWAPFFGQPAYTMTLAARLAQQCGSRVVLLWCERLPGARGYVVHVSALPEPLPAPAGDDEQLQVAAASVVNRAMEALIRQNPGQYIWAYNRYRQPRPMVSAHG